MADPTTPPVYTPPPAPKPKTRGVRTPRSRMAARLIPIPRVYDREDAKVKKVVKKPVRRAVQLRAKAPIDDQYKARVTFSEAFGTDAGKVWSEPLEIEDRTEWAGKDIYWRLEIDQFRVDPLLQGFQTEWQLLTPGWTFVDGLGGTLDDEAISNPVTITRVIKAPAAITVRPKFRVVVKLKYKP
jgi:hypothetical protein